MVNYIQGEHVFVRDHNNFWSNGNYIGFDEDTGKHLVSISKKERIAVNSDSIVPKNTHRKKETKNEPKEPQFDREDY